MQEDTSNAIDWRYEYPWGRKLPEKRLKELGARKADICRKMRILQDRFEERMIDFQRQLEAVEADIAIAEKCEHDRRRRQAKDIAHKLDALGIDVFDRINEGSVSAELLEELRELYLRTKNGDHHPPENPETAQGGGNGNLAEYDGFVDQEILDESLLTASEIESLTP
jgi:hypothetical protein